MRKEKKIFLLFVALTTALICCKPKFDNPKPQKGSANVSNYVAIGNAGTAGLADGALYYEAQKNSFVTILAEQFKLIGGGEFNIPFVPINSNGISVISGNTISIKAKSMLANFTDCKSVTSLSPVKLIPSEDYSFFSNTVYQSVNPFNNMGIPNAKIIHVLFNGYGNTANTSSGNFNPFYQRIASNTINSSILKDAVNRNPTFFSVLIGSDDAMAFALAGGAGDSITSITRFNNHVDSIINNLTKNGAQGVIGNIPDLSSYPFFTTIPYNGLTTDQSQTDQLNNLYNPLGINVSFSVGSNAFVISDASVPFGLRKITADEYILLTVPLDSVKCNSYGSLIPIPNRHVLTKPEINSIQSAINNYNYKLKTIALAKGLAFVDVNLFYKQISSGILYNGITLNAQFVKGGVFSLDGLNLNPIGNALLANEFIKSINSTYGSSIPQVDVTKYKGVIFP